MVCCQGSRYQHSCGPPVRGSFPISVNPTSRPSPPEWSPCIPTTLLTPHLERLHGRVVEDVSERVLHGGDERLPVHGLPRLARLGRHRLQQFQMLGVQFPERYVCKKFVLGCVSLQDLRIIVAAESAPRSRSKRSIVATSRAESSDFPPVAALPMIVRLG